MGSRWTSGQSSPEATRTVAGGPSEASDRRIPMPRRNPTPAGVAYQIPSGVNFLRDPCRGRENARIDFRGSLASLGPPATVRDAIRRLRRHGLLFAPWLS